MNIRSETNRFILHWEGPGSSHNMIGQSAVDNIRHQHINSNGWSDIGYHRLIDRNGDSFAGRDEQYVGAHAEGANSDSIGICMMYGTDDSSVTKESVDALVTYLISKHKQYNIIPSSKSIIGHCDTIATQCPGIVYPLIPSIIERVKQGMENNVTVKLNGQVIGKGIIVDGKSFLPVAVLLDKLGLKYTFDNKTKTVNITK
jgi:hypothetical protein